MKNLVHGIFLAAENPAAIGEVFNLTDGESVTKLRFVGKVAELAGLRPPTRHIPLGLAQVLANVVEGVARFRGAKNPPLINKARYKFLGLNLDYSIDKARNVLGYQPPFTFDVAIERAMEEHRPSVGKPTAGRLSGGLAKLTVTREERRDDQPEGQARGRPGGEVLRGPRALVSRLAASRGRLRREDRRPQGR